MPAAIVAVIPGIVAGSLTASILEAVIGMIISFALNAVTGALFGKPKPKGPTDSGRTLTFRDPVTSRIIIYGQTRVGGALAFVGSTESVHRYLHLVVVLASHQLQAVNVLYFDDEVVPIDGSGNATGKYAGFARIKVHLGAWDQVADSDLVAESTNWTSAHRGQGLAYLYVRLKYSTDKFPNGIPNISAIVRGRKVYDQRDIGQDPADPDTWLWSDNAALCVADYMRGVPMRDGTGAVVRLYGPALQDNEIDFDTVTAAANVCDEAVTLAAGGTEDRYACDGIVDTATKPSEVIESLLTGMAGKAIPVGGIWQLFAGAAQSATVTLGLDDLREGSIKISPRLPRSDIYNAVKGKYVSPLNQFEPADFPPVTNATYQAQDAAPDPIFHDIDLPYTSSAARAQRLAKIHLEQGRQQITVELKCKLTAFRLTAGGVVQLTLARYGWTNKLFEVVSWTFAVFDDAKGSPALGIDLVLRETATAVWDWNSGEETTIDPAPDTNLPDPFDVAPPTGLTVTEELYVTRDGAGVKSRAIVDWIEAEDAFVNSGGRYRVEYRLLSATPTPTPVPGETDSSRFGTYFFLLIGW